MFEQPTVELSTAILAGFLSFISPCVLPLIPGYLSFISGVSMQELTSREKSRSSLTKLVVNTIFFVLGFSFVFILLGASATGIGALLLKYLDIFNKIAGVLVFIFGLHVAGVFQIKALNYEKRFFTSKKKTGVLGSALIGIAFAFGWTPCIGPILGTILALAAQQKSIYSGIFLLAAYSAGLGIPFILTALLFNYLMGAFGFIKRHFRAVEIFSGALLMAVGVLIFFNLLQRISTFLMDLFPFLQEVG
ncbi:MAG: cytochrome c biogenesis protein CcdA [candidate division Zixibacteria bacterium]|nr:cytochrome c biogenesis protein CcdA [candidate division Zixibacteria bacterium]